MATFEPYIPTEPPRQASLEVRRFLAEELGRIAEIINRPEVFAEPLNEEPAKPEDGLIAYADGTDWNPGSGEGFYGYENGSWVKL